MSLDSDNEYEEIQFYRERPEWKDVTPINLDEGPNPIVSIAYSDLFKDVFGYFRAVVVSNERSERAFELTKTAAELNAANYTVWQYRRLLIQDLNKSLVEELEYCREIIEKNAKNYQVWHHRQWVVGKLNDVSKELRFTEIILSQDPKNYHAWTHRQWVLTKFGIFSHELEYVDRLLADDIFNNSAWNHRFFVIKNWKGFTPEVIKSEIEYTIEAISKSPSNESSWSYLRGILEQSDGGLSGYPEVIKFCETLYDSGNRSIYHLDFLIGTKQSALEKGELDEQKKQLLVEEIVNLCKDLAENIDVIRKAYWNYVALSVVDEYGEIDSTSSHR